MIEKRIQRRLEAMTPALMVQLGKVYNSLKDGMSVVSDWFGPTKAEPEKGSINVEDLKPGAEPNRGHGDENMGAVNGGDGIDRDTEGNPIPQEPPNPKPKAASGRGKLDFK